MSFVYCLLLPPPIPFLTTCWSRDDLVACMLVVIAYLLSSAYQCILASLLGPFSVALMLRNVRFARNKESLFCLDADMPVIMLVPTASPPPRPPSAAPSLGRHAAIRDARLRLSGCHGFHGD